MHMCVNIRPLEMQKQLEMTIAVGLVNTSRLASVRETTSWVPACAHTFLKNLGMGTLLYCHNDYSCLPFLYGIFLHICKFVVKPRSGCLEYYASFSMTSVICKFILGLINCTIFTAVWRMLIVFIDDGWYILMHCIVCSVVFQSPDERNYHIFYQLCTAADAAEFIDFQLGMEIMEICAA